MARLAYMAALLAAGMIAGPASAVVYDFAVTTDPAVANPFPTFSFDLPDTPAGVDDLGYGFTVHDVETNGTSQYGPVTYTADYSFYLGSGLDAGFDDSTAYHSYSSEQLFTGSAAQPTFRLGTFALYDDPSAPAVATLTISAPASSAVPEPLTWAMMAVGMGVVGTALRRSRSTNPA